MSISLNIISEGAMSSLKADIARGVADISAGRVRELDMNEIKQLGRAELKARRSPIRKTAE
jgi:hypothetical protein